MNRRKRSKGHHWRYVGQILLFCLGTMALWGVLDLPPVWATTQLASIENSLQTCLENHPGTSSETHCYRNNAGALEREIQRLYFLLGGDQNRALQQNQQVWQNYVSAEQFFFEFAYYVPGSQSQWLKARSNYLLFHSRAVALQSYLDFAEAHR